MLHTKLGEISFAIGLVEPWPGFYPLPPLSELDGTVIRALSISFVCQQRVICCKTMRPVFWLYWAYWVFMVYIRVVGVRRSFRGNGNDVFLIFSGTTSL